MTGFRVALSFLTILPVGPRDMPEKLASGRAYFPLVGLFLGSGLAALDIGLREIFPPLLVGAILLVSLIVATRGLHMDGFLDSCDALVGGLTRERRLEIMRDPRVGAFGAIGAVALLAVLWAALVSLESPVRLWVLILFPGLSRWGMLLTMEVFPYARAQGLGAAFARDRSRWQVMIGLSTVLLAAVALAGWAGLLMLAMATMVAWGLGRWIETLLGGLTGDGYGAVNEVTAVAVLLLAIALAGNGASLFAAPLPTGA